MGLKVTPATLNDAATTIGNLANTVKDAKATPPLGASRGVDGMKGSAIAAALGKADPASTVATQVLCGRFTQFSSALSTSAKTYHDSDTEAAQRLWAIGELNDGQP
ncbi:type VII secretion target [Nocardia sp. CDC153]|uniref:type VII secretion target n=1 Tax=Nocardia sp. CDC153 TaxID=3112167 RepID=UPI002DBD1E8E|nr:type VII secretion target [Nocardia sp. CDC153]MEC3957262.1 type VII secretion target [Nocardia sp. CDC153]